MDVPAAFGLVNQNLPPKDLRLIPGNEGQRADRQLPDGHTGTVIPGRLTWSRDGPDGPQIVEHPSSPHLTSSVSSLTVDVPASLPIVSKLFRVESAPKDVSG